MNQHIIMAFIMLLLSACDKPDAALDQYIKELKSRAAEKMEPIPTFQNIKPLMAIAVKVIQSPFEPKHHAQGYKKSLEDLELCSLKFVGVIRDGKQIWALIKQSDELISRVQIGDRLGENHGQLIAIEDTELTIEQTIIDHKRRVLVSVG